MFNVPTARDCMSTYFVTLTADMDIYDAMDVLLKKRASGAPVINAEGDLLGVLTEKDCLRVLSNDAYALLSRGTVADYMSEIKASVGAEMDLFAVAEVFLSNNFSILPVMDENRLVGRVSRQDMLRAIIALERNVREMKESEKRELQMRSRPNGINQLQNLFAKHRPENVAALFNTLNRDEY
jgi:CBS domain-containing protein